MDKLKELKTYLGYRFSSGCYTGEDYKTFERKYINALKNMCENNNWRLVKFSKITTAFLPLSKVVKRINMYIFQLVMLDILITIGVITYLLELQKMKKIMLVDSTFTPHSTILKAKFVNY